MYVVAKMDSDSSLAHEHVLSGTGAAEPANPDDMLAKAVAGGDTDAWERLFDRFLHWAYRFAYYHLGQNKADAEDLCSDILHAAARSIGGYNANRGSLDIWMLGVARHCLIRLYRRRRIEIPETAEFIESAIEAGGSGPSASESLILARDQIHRILASMPERQSTVLIGKYLEGYSVGELASKLETTPKAVEMLLRRARNAFRAAFSGPAGGDEDERS